MFMVHNLFQKLWNSPLSIWGLIVFFTTAIYGNLVTHISPVFLENNRVPDFLSVSQAKMQENKFLAEAIKQARFEHISVDDGLSQSSVYSIIQDNIGFMWFGTQDGLNKFDGYDFTVYNSFPESPNGFSNYFIRALYQDKDNCIWIGTDGGGLNKLDPNTDQITVYQNDPKNSHSLTSNYIWAIYQDSHGKLWIGTDDGGLNLFDPTTEQFSHYKYDPDNPYSISSNSIRVFYEDGEGALWIGTDNGGLNQLNYSTGQFRRYQADRSNPYSLSNDSIWAIYEDKDGMFWIGTDGGGLDRFDPETERFFHYQYNPSNPHGISNNSVRAILEDNSGMLWIGTNGGGINRLDPTTGKFIQYRNDLNDPYSLSSDWVVSLYKDQSGALWIGTNGGGINFFNFTTQNFITYRNEPGGSNSLKNSFVWAIHEDHTGILWFGTNGDGLSGYDQNKGEWYYYNSSLGNPVSLSGNTIRSIHEDQGGILWIGTSNGILDRLDRSAESITHYRLGNTPILSIFEDSDGILWIGTFGDGLFKYDDFSDHFLSYNLGSDSFNFIWSMCEGKDNILWIGSEGEGLVKLDRSTEKSVYYQYDTESLKNLSSNFILSVYEDQLGILWVGTFGGGLNRFDRKNEIFTSYTEKDGLPNDVIYGILEDNEHNLWLSTNNGISKFNPQTESFSNYDVKDGLQSNEFNAGAYYKSGSGEMFFGGIHGVSAFFPSLIKSNSYRAPIVLTSLTQGGKSVELDQDVAALKEITFRWPNNFFEFEFVALSYIRPEKNQYAYILEGLDKDWNEMGTNRFGKYTDLPGGTYTLRLKGSNNNAIWNEDGIAVKVTVIPLFWETKWFLSLAAFIVVGIIVGGYRLQVKNMENRSRELESLVKIKTAELQKTNEQLQQEIAEREQTEKELAHQAVETAITAERNRLARDLHDAVTQTLFSASLIAEVIPKLWETNRSEGKHHLDELRELTRGALAEMRTLLLELRPTALMEMELGDLLQQLAESVTGRARIPVNVSVEGVCENLVPEVKITLYRIAQEALNNITKHAGNCYVEIQLHCLGNQIDLSITDDGNGFNPGQISLESLGLGIMRERAEAIGAKIAINSKVGQGTAIKVAWINSPEEQE